MHKSTQTNGKANRGGHIHGGMVQGRDKIHARSIHKQNDRDIDTEIQTDEGDACED